ncbi:MAG: YraN family protein [Patescibacteria group bacterium]|nr:YraN family protein [Patescibacteria group bacterium]
MTTKKRQLGSLGERMAEEFLRKKKYKIIERNFQNKFGEIDLIAKDKKQLVFVEVKLKSSQKLGLPEEEFHFYKKKRLKKAIYSYLMEKKIQEENWRVDLVAIELNQNQPLIRHHQAVEI